MLSVYGGAVAGFINVESFFVQKIGSYVGKRIKKNCKQDINVVITYV